MRRWCVLLAWIGLQMATASSDPGNLEGGVFLAHHPPGVQYSQGVDWCQTYVDSFAIDSCSEQHNRIDLDGNEGQSSVWYVLAAWTEEKQWCGTEFGLGEYDPDIYAFAEWGPCSPGANLEIPTGNWPGPSEGTAVTTTDTAWSGNFVPVYWFSGYAYYEGVIPLAADPATDFGGTGNCATPPESWAADAFGGMGIFEDGIYACPEGDGEGGDSGPEGGDGGPDSPDEPEPEEDGGGELPVAPYVPPDNPSPIVSAYIRPTAISFGDRHSGPTAVELVTFKDAALRDTLINIGVQTIAPQYPRVSLADTTIHDTNGRPVSVPDVSSFYLLQFEDSTAAIQAIPSLDRTSGIRSAEVLTARDHVTTFPNDPYFDAWMDHTDDVQWFLQNDGEREAYGCSPAEAGEDIQAQGGWGWTLGDSTVVIGIVDAGIWGGAEEGTSHEDLRVIPLSYDQRASISIHPSCDWCAEHGTLMGGIAAARTNNAVGVAGVCGNCSLLDIECAGCDSTDCANHVERECNDVDPYVWPAKLRAALSLDLDDKVLY
ncbi:MAG: hypothetical protein FJ313_07020, partial [Gemmatimonadetes bacterium]|nr:hypothetical protein [Gemmatimonadota bacterium]